jgi:tetratricopeptide (TPR) repeat protein
MSGQIFISYRRDDSSASAGRLYDRLLVRLPNNHIFIDVDLEPGIDFVEAIESSVSSCDVLIAVIGKRWLTSSDEEGKRRLGNSDDFVRLEIATALKRNIRVIPVLVDGALMPRSSELPDDLKLLARRNALEVSHNRFNADSGRLVTAIKGVLERVDTERKESEEKDRLEAQPRDIEEKQRSQKQRDEFLLSRMRKSAAAATTGYAYYRKQDYDKAIMYYSEAIHFNPNYAETYNKRGLAYFNKNDYDKAISDYSEAIRLKPDYSAYCARGFAYAKKKEYDKAITDYNQAISLNPNLALAYTNRAFAYKSQGKHNNAKADFAKADERKKAGY